ncbi:hypothetical protein [Microbacter margulisiae]|uniref:DUF4405 domain-containing protein n=1 Tax=Microbacter margulisiae TaxID=1350067 RepID=A0A7W5H1N0_9PORP|nr:hypothetical protein [Microbacter margulisiae]MBB3186784.1 hypothetical protein [Microbacter margulisiae]
MSNKTPAQLVRQISLSLLLLSAITQALTILSFLFEIHSHVIMEVHKANGFVLYILVLTHIFVFRKNLKFYLFPKKIVGKKS